MQTLKAEVCANSAEGLGLWEKLGMEEEGEELWGGGALGARDILQGPGGWGLDGGEASEVSQGPGHREADTGVGASRMSEPGRVKRSGPVLGQGCCQGWGVSEMLWECLS
jgi:hypothetical protein